MIIKTAITQEIKYDAVQLNSPNIPSDVAAWCGGSVKDDHTKDWHCWIEFSNLTNKLVAQYGDWIVKGSAEDEYYVFNKYDFLSYFEIYSK